MSKLKTRIILSIVISLAVILAVYTTVLGAPLNFLSERAEAHYARGAMTTYGGALVTERDAYYSELDAYSNSSAKDGHDCRDQYNGPID